MNDDSLYLFAIALVVFVLVVYLIVLCVAKRREHIVSKTSVRLKKLSEVNERYSFNEGISSEYGYELSLPTKSKFDRYEMSGLFDAVIWGKEEVRDAANMVVENQELYEQYKQETDLIESEITAEEAKKLHIGLAIYKETESKLFQKRLKQPILQSKVICTARYTSPKGRNSYSKKAEFSIDQVPSRYKVLQANVLWQNSEERRRQRARSQMTDKLRYTILKRDGFRCRLCGRSADDGVKLHVDHIIPVSKGGETTPDNLRTLCDECNQGKGDEIE